MGPARLVSAASIESLRITMSQVAVLHSTADYCKYSTQMCTRLIVDSAESSSSIKFSLTMRMGLLKWHANSILSLFVTPNAHVRVHTCVTWDWWTELCRSKLNYIYMCTYMYIHEHTVCI